MATANSRKLKICAGPCAVFPPLRTGTESSFLELEAREFDRTDPLERYKLAYASSLMMLMLSSIQINHTAHTYRKIGTKTWSRMLLARFLEPITTFNLLLVTPLLHPRILHGINTLYSEVGGEGMVLLQGCTHTFSVIFITLLTYSNSPT